MLFGRVLRPERFGSTLESVDTRAAEAMPEVVVVRDGDFVAVAAPVEHVAARAVSAIRARWKPVEQPSGKDLFASFRTAPIREKFDLPESHIQQNASYTVAYIAHAPLEPRAAVA